MHNDNLPKSTMKIPTQLSKACRSLAAITSGLLLASAAADAGVIFQADFNGPGGGTGGSNDMVTVGGTGAIVADGVNVNAFITNTNPFTPGGGNYLETQRLTASGGGQYSPVLFTFASNSNSWAAWQGADVLDPTGAYDTALHGAFDVFFRVDSSSSTNDASSFRTLDQYSWSDGGNGLNVHLNGQNGGWLIFQLANSGFQGGGTPAIANFTASSGASSYDPNYDTINMYFNGSSPITNGLVYHIAFSLNTDTNGLTTANLYLGQGTGALDPAFNLVQSASFNILSANLLNWAGLPTDQAFTNQPFNFGVGWAADGLFVTDYASPRLYDSVPATFTALPGSPSATLSSAPPQPNVVFEADFNGPGAGTGGNNDMVTVGGTGAIVADGVNVKGFITNANPFTPGAGNYLETQRLTASGGGQYSPVLFTFASNSNSWAGWQGADVLDPTGAYDTALHGAFDVFFRVDSSSSTNDASSFRTLDQYSWSDGGNGLNVHLNGQNGGWLIFQIANSGFQSGSTPAAIENFTASSGASSYDPNYDTINMYFNSSSPITNGLVYHIAFSLDTDTNGLTTANLYLGQGTGALDPAFNLVQSASFNILSANLLNWAGLPTDQAFTNQPFNFGVGWAADGLFVTDYASPRLYNSMPATFTALPSPLKFLPSVVSGSQITLSWTGSGRLQWAPTIQGPWTFITPAPASPYSEARTPGNRFYRLLAR